jgi:hypothetical protein
MISLHFLFKLLDKYLLPMEWFCKSEDPLVIDLRIGNCCHVKSSRILNINEPFYSRQISIGSWMGIRTRRNALKSFNIAFVKIHYPVASRSRLSFHKNLSEICIWQDGIANKMRILFLHKLPNGFLGFRFT